MKIYANFGGLLRASGLQASVEAILVQRSLQEFKR